jgi:hypothetical protein
MTGGALPRSDEVSAPRLRHGIARATLGVLIAGLLAAQASPAAASVPVRNTPDATALAALTSDLPYGPDTCKNGFVWREARPSDHVCVTPTNRQTTWDENALADSRREPNGGPYGPNTCKQGYVWRGAFDGDVVCVTPDRRTQAEADNAAAAERRLSGTTAPGTQTVTLGLAHSRWASGLKEFESIFHSCDASKVQQQSRGRVGWGQAEEEGCFAYVAQLAVLFDTAPLDGIPDKIINRAVLTYDESQDCWDLPEGTIPPGSEVGGPITCWQSGSARPENKPNGCVVVRVPAQEWLNAPPGSGLRPYITHPSGHPTITRGGPREWDVTEPFRWQTVPSSKPLNPPGQPPLSPGFGFLLTGEITSLDQLTGDDDTFCLSTVSNIRLQVTYTVLPEGGPGPIVK